MNVWIKRRDEDCRFLPRNPGDTIEPWTTGNTVIFLDMLRLMSHGSHREIQTNRQKKWLWLESTRSCRSWRDLGTIT